MLKLTPKILENIFKTLLKCLCTLAKMYFVFMIRRIHSFGPQATLQLKSRDDVVERTSSSGTTARLSRKVNSILFFQELYFGHSA